MSTGSVTKEPKSQLDYTQAHEWCIELRKILGNVVTQKLGLGTDARALAQAEEKVYDRLKELHKLFPEGLPVEARELEKKYSELAKEGFMLREQYLGYEEDIKSLEGQVKRLQEQRKSKETKKSQNRRQVKDLIDQKIERLKLEIETTKGLRESKKTEIADKSDEFSLLATDLKENVDNRIKQKEDYRKDLLAQKIAPDAIKMIVAAQSTWKKEQKESQKLVEYFEKNCDSGIAKLASIEFQKCSVDIYSIYSVPDAQRLLAPMTIFLRSWGASGKKGEYEAARERFAVSYKKAKDLATQAQKVCEGPEFTACLLQFTEGESEAIQKNWLAADLKVNDALIQRFESVINTGASGKSSWWRIKDQFEKFQSDLNVLGDPAFTALALTPLGTAYKLADRQEYPEAVKSFNENKAATAEVLEVARKVESVRKDLANTRDAILNLIGMIPHGPMSLLANTFDKELQGLPDEFWSERHVATLKELEDLRLVYVNRLNEIKVTVQSYTSTDPDVVLANNKLAEELQSGRNAEACKEVIQSLADAVAPAISAYKAAFFSPTAPLPDQPLGGWEQHLQSALDFLAKLEAHTRPKDPVLMPQNEIQDSYKANKTNLDGLAKTIRDLITGQATEIELARGKIVEALKWFKAELFITRLDTVFKEATWHKEAKLEYEELLALSTVDNLAQLQQLLPDALKLQERCKKVLKAMPQKLLDGVLGPNEGDGPAYFEGTQAQIDYDDLKSRLKSIRSALKDKDVLFYVPREVEKVSTQLAEADSALRSEGYVGLTDNAVLLKHKNAISNVENSLIALKVEFEKIKSKRMEVDSKLVRLQTRITTDLITAIEKSTGQKVESKHLPLMQSVMAMTLRLNTENLNALSTLDLELGMMEDELNLLLLETDTPGGLQDQVTAFQNGKAEENKAIELKREAKIDYEIARKEFDDKWKKVKAIKGVDQSEVDAIRSIKQQAIEATKSKPENWSKAAKDIKLGTLLSERLIKDPIASQATNRGQKNLKELTPRWIKGIDRLGQTVNPGLQGAIESACQADTENVADANGIVKLFESTVGIKFSDKTLVKDAFASELLVLQRIAGGSSMEKQADKKEKKKAREQALVKVRYYKNMVQKDPVYQDLLFKKNPWSNKGGQVDGLPLMRALNDLELNIERGIY